MMLGRLVPMDEALEGEDFKADEVPYNLLHLIGAAPEMPSFKQPDGRMIFARSARGNAWLWMQDAVSVEVRERWLRMLVQSLGETELPGVTGAPEVAEHFARLYTEAHDRSYRCVMMMEAYHCPVVSRPQHVNGSLREAAAADSREVARFLAGFSEDAYGVRVQAEDRIEAAERLIEQGGLYLWTAGGALVSMANIAHRSPRHGRINAVYTPKEERKKGYASVLVAELGLLLNREGLTPMLYADQANPDSNRVYRNIGFTSCGTIAELAFSGGE